MNVLGFEMTSTAARRFASLVVAGLMTLIVASPAMGYNETNVKHIRISRLDPIVCNTPIRLVADLTDKKGAAVPGATVDWSFSRSRSGDTLTPSTSSSDSAGRAATTLLLACQEGTRKIKASVPGDGSAKITIKIRKDHDEDNDHHEDEDNDHHEDEDNDHHDDNDNDNGNCEKKQGCADDRQKDDDALLPLLSRDGQGGGPGGSTAGVGFGFDATPTGPTIDPGTVAVLGALAAAAAAVSVLASRGKPRRRLNLQRALA